MTHSTDQFGPAAKANASLPSAPASTLQGQRGNDLLQQQKAILTLGRRAIAPPEVPILVQDAAVMLARVLGTQFGLVTELAAVDQPPQLELALHDVGSADPSVPISQASITASDSLAGYAEHFSRPVVVHDLGRTTKIIEIFLRKHGVRSLVAAPLELKGRPLGALAACAREYRDFGEQDLLFVETIAHLVTMEIGRVQTEKLLADERRFTREVLQTINALVIVLDWQGRIVNINSACERLTGFTLKEIQGRPVWSVFAVAKEVGVWQQLAEQIRKQESPVEYESCLLTKHSQQLQVAWSCSATGSNDGAPGSIIATGVDITEQRQAETKAEQAVEDAEKARGALARALLASERRLKEVTSAASAGGPEAADSRMTFASEETKVRGGRERRRHPRRSFPYKQRIAAVAGTKLPEQQAFIEVQCFDISASGFSFLSVTRPASDTLVVALGVPPNVDHLVAKIAHVTRVEVDGRQRFLIGCQYVGRASYQDADA